MSTKSTASLHIEWSPGRVHAFDVSKHRNGTGTSLAEVSSITSGHKEALIGVSRNAVFLKSVSLPKAAPEDLRRILSVQIGQIFPLPSDQLAFDFFQTNEHGPEGYRTVVAAMRADDLRLLQGELQRAGLRAVRILPVALGAAAVAARAHESDALVMEATGMGLALDIVQGGTVRYSRVAPITNDLVAEARRTLLAYGGGEKVLITAGGLTDEGTTSRPETALELLQESHWAGFELAEERLRVVKRRVAIQTRLAGLLMLSALLLVGLVWADRSDAQAVVTRGQGTWTRELSKLRSIRDTEIGKAQKMGEQETALTRAFKPGQTLSDVAKAIGDTLPANSWLTGLTLERGKIVQFRGTTTAPDEVASYLKNLASIGRFRDVKLVFANSGKISETNVVQFSVTAIATGNLPLPEPPKKNARKSTGTTSTTTKTTEQKDSPQL